MPALITHVALALAALAAVAAPARAAIEVKNETYTLPNGLTVILHEDHRLPQVVVNIWYGVGSKDEAPGRTGFAHLFEHLMFMGTVRVPNGQFDALMEAGGGSNNASTSNDITSYYSIGPNSLLPLLLWLDADRMDALGASMTQQKLDLQRDVVRNERRQSVENAPYGESEIIIAESLYSAGHPYHHSVIGSHEDLQAATVKDVQDFFSAFYVPSNASLVVAGDFDPAVVKPLIASLFGAVPARPAPAGRDAAPPALEREIKRLAVDDVEFPRLYLVWPAPAEYAPGAAEMDLAADILGGGPSSRLEKRLVHETRLAQSVNVFLDARRLSSEFQVVVTAAPGADLERVKRETLAVIDDLTLDGPTEAEMQRVKAQVQASFLRGVESLLGRAMRLNDYYRQFGEADAFERDLKRYSSVNAGDVKTWTEQVLGPGRLDLRIIPGAGDAKPASLDQRPADWAPKAFTPPAPTVFKLRNGIEVQALAQPGSGLFAGALLVDGGERLVPADKAGLASLTADLLTSGAAGRDAAAFAQAVESLGASINAFASRNELQVSVNGLSVRLGETLDLFADAVLRPNLAEEDFKREAALALARIDARADRPNVVANLVGRAQIFGLDDSRGRPTDGRRETVASLTLADARALAPVLAHPARARFVFVGDFSADGLRRALDERFGSWRGPAATVPPAPTPLTKVQGGRVFLVDRPGAPQTVIFVGRPAPGAAERERVLRSCINTLFGGSFTSRLNQNLREKHGYTYGVRSSITQEGPQHVLGVTTAVQTPVTGAALGEIRKEFASLAGGDVGPEEAQKSVRTERQNIVESVQTTASLAGVFAKLIADGRPPDDLVRTARVLESASAEELNSVARSGIFDWNGLIVVLVGDNDQVAPQLEAAGLPRPVLVDAEGRPL